MNETGIKNRIAYVLSMVIITVAIVLVVVASWLAFTPILVITSNVQPYKVLTKEIEAGDVLLYEADTCKYLAISSTVVRRFIDEDGTRYPQPPESSNMKEGCSKSRVPVPTPSTLHAGVWYVDIEVAYQVNPLRSEHYRFVTETFNIIESKE